QKAHRVARAIKAGTVWVNTYNFYDPAAPFGGYKFSGFGRDLGREALDNYTETKTVWVGLCTTPTSVRCCGHPSANTVGPWDRFGPMTSARSRSKPWSSALESIRPRSTT